MRFSYNWLNSFFKEEIPEPDKLSADLMMHFFEVEEVKKVEDDWMIDIDILPNRAYDCFSHLGIAKEIAAIYNLKLELPEVKIKSSEKKATDFIEVEVDDKELCPRYTLRVIEGVKVGKTPDFIKKRLEVCGLQSINNIVDITNYVMLETGQPLHAFDGTKVKEKITVRKAEKGEEIETLDGVKYKFDYDPLLIADEEKAIGIAGIKGGSGTEIDDDTELIFLEAANFNPKKIREGSKKLKLRTDASSRFEHGLNPELTREASDRAISLIQKYAEGKETKDFIDLYFQRKEKKVIDLSLKNLNSLLGVEVKKAKVRSILESLNFKVEEGNDLKVTVPIERDDIEMEEDLIEEVGRMYGYENIEPVRPSSTLTVPEVNPTLFWKKRLRNSLSGLGYNESYNYSFINERCKELFDFENLIEMDNPVSEDYKYLRTSLIPHLLKNIKINQERFSPIGIFEVGKTFKDEEEIFVSGVKTKTDFRAIKGDVDLLLKEAGVEEIRYEVADAKDKLWSSETAKIEAGEDVIGFIGKINSDILKEMKIDGSVFAFELKMDKIMKVANLRANYRSISKFPTAVRDISILVPQKVRYREVLNKVEVSGKPLLVKVDLFDLYQGEKIPKGKKNMGLRLVFQAEDRTLSKKEIDRLLEKIITALEKESKWKVRKSN